MSVKHSQFNARRAAGRGFSLLELLVSIGVVSVMMGVLLPALSGAREAARQSECDSNLRQLGVAAHAYADDFRGHMPPGAADFLQNLSRWHGSRSNPSERFRAEGGALTEYLGETASGDVLASPIRRCGSFVPVLRTLADRGTGFELACGGYGYNNTYVGVQRYQGGGRRGIASDRAGQQLSRFYIPAKTICFSDTAFASDAGADDVIEYSFIEPRFWPDSPGSRADPSLHFRHGGTAGIAWLDTHVSRERMTYSWSSGLFGVDAASVGIGFTGSADDNSLYGEE